MPCIICKNCSGSKSYIKLAEEFLEQNNQKIECCIALKKGLGKGLSALFGDIENKIESKIEKIPSISDIKEINIKEQFLRRKVTKTELINKRKWHNTANSSETTQI